MKIYRAMFSDWVTQKFGEENTNPTMIELYRSLGLKGHNGWDFLAGDGQELYWDGSCEGVVLETSLDEKAGLGVVIGTENKHKHIFWHLKEVIVQPGELLETGALLGYADSTGISFGDHLHRGLKETDDNYYTINRDNGYDGAIDIGPFFKNIFVLQEMENLKKTLEILQKQVSLWQRLIDLLIKLKSLFK